MVSQDDRPDGALPSVTVIIAAYNAADTITRAIRSALAEPEVSEVIVVDDASSDTTISRARTADDGSSRLKIIQQDKNQGPSAARNRAIQQSTAQWIGILDADDFFISGRIHGLLQFSENADFVADDLWQVSEYNVDGERKRLLGDTLTQPRIISFMEFVLSNVSDPKQQRKELGFIKPIMRRDFLIKNNIYYQEHMRLGEDYEMYARSLALGARLNLVPAQGYISVVRENSLSGNHTELDLLNLRNCNDILKSTLRLSPADQAALRQHHLSVDCRLQWRLLINAVKNKKGVAAIKTFLRPFPVPIYLLSQLMHQLVFRTSRKFKGHI